MKALSKIEVKHKLDTYEQVLQADIIERHRNYLDARRVLGEDDLITIRKGAETMALIKLAEKLGIIYNLIK